MKAQLLLLSIAILLSIDEIAIGQESSTDAVISAVAPVYPRLARLTRTSGKMRMEVYVDRYGVVTDATAIKEDIDSYVSFHDVSKRTALRWKFAVAKDETSRRKYVLTFTYRIMPDQTSEDELMPIFHYPYEIEVRNTAVNPLVHESPAPYTN